MRDTSLRPPFVAAACLIGNLVVHGLPALPGKPWLVPIALIVVLALSVRALRLIAVAACAALYTACAAEQRLDERLDTSLNGRDFTVVGWVDGFPERDTVRTRFSFRVEHGDDALPRRLRLSWYDAPERLEPAMPLELTVRLWSPRGLMNPGGFDYERWLMLEGFGATGYVRNGQRAAASAPTAAREWLALRHELAQGIASRAFEDDTVALVMALTLGERSHFDDTHWRVLRRTGTTHLVAISGLHIGLLAFGTFRVVRRCCLWGPGSLAAQDLTIAALASGLVAVVYAALAGFALPTQRALVMLGVALYVVLSRRKVARFDGVAFALVLVLAFDPLASLAASFWLSFGAVALLLALGSVRASPRFADASPYARRIRAFSRLQWWLSLGLVPLVVIYFGELSLMSPFINLLAIPWFSLVLVPMALLTLGVEICGLSVPILDAALGHAAGPTWSLLERAADAPWSATFLPEPSLAAATLGLIGVVCALPWHAMPGRRLAWLGLLPLFVVPRADPGHGRVDVIVLDVGHGLAVLLETSGHRMLYDAGPTSRSGFDTGAELLVPMLARRPGSELDLLLVGHADSDHAGGARAVLEAHPEASVLHGPDVDNLGGRACRAGQRWAWDGVVFAILHPPSEFSPLGNDSSCVLHVSTSRHSLLITGDIERRAETRLAALEVAADVIVVPHHGSATSSSTAFVAAVSPTLAIVSAGYENRWGFPRPEVRARWKAAGAKLLVTGESGAVRLRLGGPALDAVTERSSRRRYWHSETPDLPGDSKFGAL